MSTWKDKTRDGTPVRIYAEDGGGSHPIHGAVYYEGTWQAEKWNKSGRVDSEGECWFDLIPNTPEIDWSKQPAWCKAIAMGKSGRWWRYDHAPYLSASGWDETGHFTQLMHPSECPDWDGDWKDSLCVRPEGETK